MRTLNSLINIPPTREPTEPVEPDNTEPESYAEENSQNSSVELQAHDNTTPRYPSRNRQPDLCNCGINYLCFDCVLSKLSGEECGCFVVVILILLYHVTSLHTPLTSILSFVCIVLYLSIGE